MAESHAKSPFGSLFNLPGRQSQSFEKNTPANKFANALRQSLQLSAQHKDYDLRDNTYLHAMRKLFEEMRVAEELNDFTSEDLFDDDVKGFDGSVHKDEFIYTLLNKEEFTALIWRRLGGRPRRPDRVFVSQMSKASRPSSLWNGALLGSRLESTTSPQLWYQMQTLPRSVVLSVACLTQL